jgi:hypothetical protein
MAHPTAARRWRARPVVEEGEEVVVVVVPLPAGASGPLGVPGRRRSLPRSTIRWAHRRRATERRP